MITVTGGVGKKHFQSKDWNGVVTSLPPVVRDQLTKNDILLAGGFIRDTLIDNTSSDIDVFCHTKELAKTLSEELNGSLLGITETVCSYTVLKDNVKVQYVYCRPFTTPESLLTEFDFTCCCVSLHWGNDAWVFTEVDTFEQDVHDRMLVFRCADYNKGNLGALTRSYRFVARGWYFPQREMAKLIHHYVAYAPAVRSRSARTDWASTSEEPTDRPMINLEAVQSSVNPTYNARARSNQ